MGSEYTKNAFVAGAFLVEPRQRVWWLQISSYFW